MSSTIQGLYKWFGMIQRASSVQLCKLQHIPYVTGSWKTYLFGTSKLWENSIENHLSAFQIKLFFPNLDNVTNIPFCYEISYEKLLFPRRYGQLYQADQCAQKVGFPRSGHIISLIVILLIIFLLLLISEVML